METQTLKEKLLNQLSSLVAENGNIDNETSQHGFRFINKLDKYGLITNNLSMSVLSDGNLTFEWNFEKPKPAKFNVDFDKTTDRLMWCCYITGMNDHLYGSVIHLEEIVPYLKRFNGIK